MKNSFQEILLHIPLHHLTFMTPLPKNPVYYTRIKHEWPQDWLKSPSLLVFEKYEEFEKLHRKEFVLKIIQDSHLMGIVLCSQRKFSCSEEIGAIFRQCGIPLVHIHDSSYLPLLEHTHQSLYPYSQISEELNGMVDKGFTYYARELSRALETPILYLDQYCRLLWQTGTEQEIKEAEGWLRKYYTDLKNGKDVKAIPGPFEPYIMNIAGLSKQFLIASADLADWQKRMLHKLTGLTSLLLQTEEIFRVQQERFKEHFIYDLLYHKFESETMMIKQGKAWGWNLEKPHHLLCIHIELADGEEQELSPEVLLSDIESEGESMGETLHPFLFQEQLIVLIEDEEERAKGERERFAAKIAEKIHRKISGRLPGAVCKIGIGKWYPQSIHLNKSYQEARLALKFGSIWFREKQICHIENFGVLSLLVHIHKDILYDFSQKYLSPLLESDRENGTEYVHTLDVYFQHQGKMNDVSEALFIHVNTLRNRLRKIEELTGMDLQDKEQTMNLYFAVRIYFFIHSIQ